MNWQKFEPTLAKNAFVQIISVVNGQIFNK